MQQQIICTGIKRAKGEFKDDGGRLVQYDSTTFYLNVDMGDGANVIGCQSSPFKFGDSTEFDKWAHLKNSWPEQGLLCNVEFGMELSGGKTVLKIKNIQPVANQSVKSQIEKK